MAIIVNEETKLIVQGITGHQGQYHTGAMKEFGTNVVGGVTPGKGGTEVLGVPVFDTMREAVAQTGANTSIIYVPARFLKDAAFEAIDSGVKTVVIITEHVPVHDAMEILMFSQRKGVRVIGPNCPGIASPGKAKVGIMPNSIFKEGSTGVVSRSGTLTYEIVNSLTEAGIGQSTAVGIGGDPIIGTTFIDALRMFQDDPQTERIVMVGEIGGTAEEEAAEFIKEYVTKPVYSYIAGRTAPPGKRMGHAGAIIARGRGTAESKIKALESVGVKVARVPVEIADLIKADI